MRATRLNVGPIVNDVMTCWIKSNIIGHTAAIDPESSRKIPISTTALHTGGLYRHMNEPTAVVLNALTELKWILFDDDCDEISLIELDNPSVSSKIPRWLKLLATLSTAVLLSAFLS
jgi:hypothetical protein